MTQALPKMTRRGFCLCCIASATFAAGGGWMTPRQAYAEAQNIVDLIRADAATATITVTSNRSRMENLIVSILVCKMPSGARPWRQEK